MWTSLTDTPCCSTCSVHCAATPWKAFVKLSLCIVLHTFFCHHFHFLLSSLSLSFVKLSLLIVLHTFLLFNNTYLSSHTTPWVYKCYWKAQIIVDPSLLWRVFHLQFPKYQTHVFIRNQYGVLDLTPHLTRWSISSHSVYSTTVLHQSKMGISSNLS